MQISQAAICSTTLGHQAVSVNPFWTYRQSAADSMISCMRTGDFGRD